MKPHKRTHECGHGALALTQEAQTFTPNDPLEATVGALCMCIPAATSPL
jgi:hypothetical protein